MKILHLSFCGPYTDGFEYQENVLTRKHVKLGFDVFHLVSPYSYNSTGIVIERKPHTYIDEFGVKITVLKHYNKSKLLKKFRKYSNVYKLIYDISPNIIFMHGLQHFNINEIIKYVRKNPNTKLYVDQHGDTNNMPLNSIKDKILQKVLYRRNAQKLVKYVDMFWGVTPRRVKYLIDIYKIPHFKTDLLVMGGDEDYINFNDKEVKRKIFIENFGIPRDNFLVVTGGKIDAKKNIHFLIEAVKGLSNVTLVIFGPILEDSMELLEKYKIENNIKFTGFLDSKQIYDIFLLADLAVFPGTHSVLWEQALSCNIPCLFKYWEGFEHLDIGGNCKYIIDDNDIVENLKTEILNIVNNKAIYNNMKLAAEIGNNLFSYIEIAKKSIGIKNSEKNDE